MRQKECDPFYKTAAWLRARYAAMSRDGFLCQDCLARHRARGYGRVRPASLVHHIKSYQDYPELGLVLENLVSLCDACHAKRHPEKGRRGQPAASHAESVGMKVIKIGGSYEP